MVHDFLDVPIDHLSHTIPFCCNVCRKEVAKQPQELTVEERNLLSVAYKNVIGSRRASWRVVTSIEQKGDPEKMTIIKDYKSKIESELVDICNDILG